MKTTLMLELQGQKMQKAVAKQTKRTAAQLTAKKLKNVPAAHHDAKTASEALLRAAKTREAELRDKAGGKTHDAGTSTSTTSKKTAQPLQKAAAGTHQHQKREQTAQAASKALLKAAEAKERELEAKQAKDREGRSEDLVIAARAKEFELTGNAQKSGAAPSGSFKTIKADDDLGQGENGDLGEGEDVAEPFMKLLGKF